MKTMSPVSLWTNVQLMPEPLRNGISVSDTTTMLGSSYMQIHTKSSLQLHIVYTGVSFSLIMLLSPLFTMGVVFCQQVPCFLLRILKLYGKMFQSQINGRVQV